MCTHICNVWTGSRCPSRAEPMWHLRTLGTSVEVFEFNDHHHVQHDLWRLINTEHLYFHDHHHSYRSSCCHLPTDFLLSGKWYLLVDEIERVTSASNRNSTLSRYVPTMFCRTFIAAAMPCNNRVSTWTIAVIHMWIDYQLFVSTL